MMLLEDVEDLAEWRSRPPVIAQDNRLVPQPSIPPWWEWVESDADADADINPAESFLASLPF